MQKKNNTNNPGNPHGKYLLLPMCYACIFLSCIFVIAKNVVNWASSRHKTNSMNMFALHRSFRGSKNLRFSMIKFCRYLLKKHEKNIFSIHRDLANNKV